MCTYAAYLLGYIGEKPEKMSIIVRVSAPHHVPSRCPVGKAGRTACSEKSSFRWISSSSFYIFRRRHANSATDGRSGGEATEPHARVTGKKKLKPNRTHIMVCEMSLRCQIIRYT